MAKQHENKTTIQGQLVRIDSRTGVTKNNQEYLGGKVFVETGDDAVIPVDFFATKTKKDGTPNGLYKSIETMVNEFKSVATHGEEEADSIEVGAGEIKENAYHNDNGALIRGFTIQAPFYKRMGNAQPKAEFIVVGEIISVEDVIKDNVPTGEALLRMLVVGYGNRANIIDFTLNTPEAVQYAKSNFSAGQEVKVQGQIVVEETEPVKEATGFGAPIVDENKRSERKLVVLSATPPVSSAITDEERNQMLSQREAMLEEGKNKKKASAPAQPKSNTASGFSL